MRIYVYICVGTCIYMCIYAYMSCKICTQTPKKRKYTHTWQPCPQPQNHPSAPTKHTHTHTHTRVRAHTQTHLPALVTALEVGITLLLFAQEPVSFWDPCADFCWQHHWSRSSCPIHRLCSWERGGMEWSVCDSLLCVCVCMWLLRLCMSVIIGRDPPGPFTACVGRGGRRGV